MSLVEYVNAALRNAAAERDGLVLFGQNVSTGSCLSGLTRGFGAVPGCTVIDTPNSENTLTGMGFGLLLEGMDSILALKQQDFLLLGLDQLVNTWNALRHRDKPASFAVLAIVVDNGWEGPQSCLNNLDDFCSFARIPGYVISNRHDADLVAGRHLFAPGAKVIGISQRLFRSPLLEVPGPVVAEADGALLRYMSGDDVTLVSCNFAFPQTLALAGALVAAGVMPSLFGLVDLLSRDWSAILADVARTGRLVVVDDSKSVNRASQVLTLTVRAALPEARVVVVDRDAATEERSAPNADTLEVDAAAVLVALGTR